METKVQSVTMRRESEIIETRVEENSIVIIHRAMHENRISGPPDFTIEQKLLVVESWHYVQDHVAEVIN